MKAIKTISLLAPTALAAMAFVGASSAMAENTTLCSADGSSCGITHVHETSVGKAQLISSFGTIECNTSFLGDVKGTALANPLVLETQFAYSNCMLGGSSCVTIEEGGPGELRVLKEGHETAKVTYENLIHIVCGSIIDCSYSGPVGGIARGPLLSTQKNGDITFSSKSLTRETGGLICPKLMTLNTTTTPLSATYISS